MAMVPTNVKKVSSHIPNDLALSVLSKLPFKSLKRLSSARKSWSFLYQNPSFFELFRKNIISRHCSFYDDTFLLLTQTFSCDYVYLINDEKCGNKIKLKLPYRLYGELAHTPGREIIIVGCVNGIICLLNLLRHDRTLWNPATKECIHIPRSPSQLNNHIWSWFTLYGFGYDHARDDYKVIQCVITTQYTPNTNVEVEAHSANMSTRPRPLWDIYRLRSNFWRKLMSKLKLIRPTCQRGPNTNVEVEDHSAYMPTWSGILWEIYSLRSKSWKKLDVNMPIKLRISEVYLNGICHWLGEYKDKSRAVECVVSFNFSSETFVTTPLLFDMHDGDDFNLPERDLMLLNGSIAMISTYSTTSYFHISILGELGVKESWVKLFTIGPLPFVTEPIGAGKNGKIFFRTKDNNLVCFDLNTQTFQEVGLEGESICRLTRYFKINSSRIIRL